MDVPAPQLEHSTAPLMLNAPGAQHRPAPVESASSPAAQGEHDVPPVRPLNVRSGQGAQAVAPKPLDTEPMGHAWQKNTEFASAELLNVPGKQAVQEVAPESAQEPSGQQMEAPGGLKVPLAQGAQESEAALALYVFAGQVSQVKYWPLTAV
jgi:hypothetical protein